MNKEDLKRQINALTQFPFKERANPYQSYWLHDEGYVKGSRDTLYRFDVMEIPENLEGKSVVDLGCQLGTMAMEAYRRGAEPVLGIEFQEEYVECAKELAKYNNFKDITFMQGDLKRGDQVPKLVKSHFGDNTIDIVFALSLYKHVKEVLFTVLAKIDFKTLYIESHNTGTNGLQTPHVQEMISYMKKYSLEPVSFIGFTSDRSPRAVWRIDRDIKVL